MKKISGRTVTVTILVLLTSGFWGFSFLATSLLVRVLEPLQLLAARWSVAGMVFLLLIAAGKVKIRFRTPQRNDLFLCAVCQPCLYMLMETYGIRLTSASVGSVMIATIPCMVLVIGTIFRKQTASRRGIVSILLAFAGVAVCTVFAPGFSIKGESTGYLLLFGAVTAGAAYSVASAKAAAEYSSLEITAFMALSGAVFFNVLNFLGGYGLSTYTAVLSSPALLGGILFLGICCSCICYFAFNKTIAITADPALANNMSSSMTTVIGVLAGILIGGEPGGWYTAAGLLMTLTGVVLSSREVH